MLDFFKDRRLVVYPSLILLTVYSALLLPVSMQGGRGTASHDAWLLFGFLFVLQLLATNRFSIALIATGASFFFTNALVAFCEYLDPLTAGFCFSLFFYCVICGMARCLKDPEDTPVRLLAALFPVLLAAPFLTFALDALTIEWPASTSLMTAFPARAFLSALYWGGTFLTGGILISVISPAMASDFLLPRNYPLLVRPTFYSAISACGVYLGLHGTPLIGPLLIFYGLYKIAELRLSEKTKILVNRIFSRIFALVIGFYLIQWIPRESGEGGFFTLILFLLLWLLIGGFVLWSYRRMLTVLLSYRVISVGGLFVLFGLWGYWMFMSMEVRSSQALWFWTGVTVSIIGFALFVKSGKDILILLTAGIVPLLIHQLNAASPSYEDMLPVAFISILCASIQWMDLERIRYEVASISELRVAVTQQAGDTLKHAFLPLAVALGTLFLLTYFSDPSSLQISLWTGLTVLLNLWLVPVLFAWTKELDLRKQDVMKDVYRTRLEKAS